jgi:hypothetical protein
VDSEDFYTVDEAARIFKRRETLRKLSAMDATRCATATRLARSAPIEDAPQVSACSSLPYHPAL